MKWYVYLSFNKLPHLLSEVGAYFFTDSLGHTHGCHSARLSTAHHTVLGVPILVQVLGKLGGLSTACLPNDDHYTVVPTY